MDVKILVAVALLGASILPATKAYSAPVYVGLQDGTAAIVTVVNGANGSASFGLTEVGGSGVYASGSVQGTPPLPEPQLLSNTLTVSGEHDGGGTVSIYVSELNQNPLNFGGFVSTFSNIFGATSTLGSGNQTANTATTVVESTYITACSPPNAACSPTYAYAEGTLLSTTTFTHGGETTVTEGASIPLGTTVPYATTEVYTITFAAPSGVNTYGQVSSSIDLSVPEPASMAIVGAGLLGLGVVRRRRGL